MRRTASKRRKAVVDLYDIYDIVKQTVIKIGLSYFVFAKFGHHALELLLSHHTSRQQLAPLSLQCFQMLLVVNKLLVIGRRTDRRNIILLVFYFPS